MPAENRPTGVPESARVHAVLDDFHAAASAADEERYFVCMAPDVVYLGTDAGERWVGEEFRAFVHPYFSQGKGWTYLPSDRSVSISEDGRTAWFDERLHNKTYGECRGTGVLQLSDDEWKIEQYNLMIPIPNELAREVVANIRELG
jgi:ketosteroid isomerase-like protein